MILIFLSGVAFMALLVAIHALRECERMRKLFIEQVVREQALAQSRAALLHGVIKSVKEMRDVINNLAPDAGGIVRVKDQHDDANQH